MNSIKIKFQLSTRHFRVLNSCPPLFQEIPPPSKLNMTDPGDRGGGRLLVNLPASNGVLILVLMLVLNCSGKKK